MSVADDVRRQITKRLTELKPLVVEYHQLEAMVRKLASGDGAARRPVAAPLALAPGAASTGVAAGVLAGAVRARRRHSP
jgi:hypothetical protein